MFPTGPLSRRHGPEDRAGHLHVVSPPLFVAIFPPFCLFSSALATPIARFFFPIPLSRANLASLVTFAARSPADCPRTSRNLRYFGGAPRSLSDLGIPSRVQCTFKNDERDPPPIFGCLFTQPKQRPLYPGRVSAKTQHTFIPFPLPSWAGQLLLALTGASVSNSLASRVNLGGQPLRVASGPRCYKAGAL